MIAPQVLDLTLLIPGNIRQRTLKDSRLISVVGLIKFLRAAQVEAGSTRLPITFYARVILEQAAR